MKKGLLLSLVCGFSLFLVSCGGGTTSSSTEPVKPSIEFYSTTLSIEQFESSTIDYKLNGISGQLTWKSSDPTIANVDQTGLVEGISLGTCNVTASINDISATCSVTITKSSVGAVLYIETTEVNVVAGDSYTFDMYVTFKGVIVNDATFKIEFLNSNPSDVANVSYSIKDKELTVTGLKAGSTVATISGEVKATFLCENINISVL